MTALHNTGCTIIASQTPRGQRFGFPLSERENAFGLPRGRGCASLARQRGLEAAFFRRSQTAKRQTGVIRKGFASIV